MNDEVAVANILKDVAFMSCVGMRPVVVHGGGKAISTALKKAGVQSEFVLGMRVTDEGSITIVEHVLNHEVNPVLVKCLESVDCKARGIRGDDILSVKKMTRLDEESGKELNWGYVGEVTAVDSEPVRAFLNAAITPVITPLGRGRDKKLYNINADLAAVAVAESLKARKLVFLSDVPGLLADPDDRASLLSTVKVAEVEGLIARGVISGGMLPKINGAVAALKSGVHKIHIIDSSVQHSLLLELFTDKGVGTEMVTE